MSADPHEMVVCKGIRYRVEDAKRLGLTADVSPDVAALEAQLAQAEADRLAAEQEAAEDAEATAKAAQEQAAAEQAEADRLAAEQAAAEKTKTPANKGRTAPTKGD